MKMNSYFTLGSKGIGYLLRNDGVYWFKGSNFNTPLKFKLEFVNDIEFSKYSFIACDSKAEKLVIWSSIDFVIISLAESGLSASDNVVSSHDIFGISAVDVHPSVLDLKFHPYFSQFLVILCSNSCLWLINISDMSSTQYYFRGSFHKLFFGPSLDWLRFTIFLLNSEGQIHFVCPIVPQVKLEDVWISDVLDWVEEFRLSKKDLTGIESSYVGMIGSTLSGKPFNRTFLKVQGPILIVYDYILNEESDSNKNIVHEKVVDAAFIAPFCDVPLLVVTYLSGRMAMGVIEYEDFDGIAPRWELCQDPIVGSKVSMVVKEVSCENEWNQTRLCSIVMDPVRDDSWYVVLYSACISEAKLTINRYQSPWITDLCLQCKDGEDPVESLSTRPTSVLSCSFSLPLNGTNVETCPIRFGVEVIAHESLGYCALVGMEMIHNTEESDWRIVDISQWKYEDILQQKMERFWSYPDCEECQPKSSMELKSSTLASELVKRGRTLPALFEKVAAKIKKDSFQISSTDAEDLLKRYAILENEALGPFKQCNLQLVDVLQSQQERRQHILMNTQKLEKLSLKLKRKFEKSREKVKNIQERYTSQKIKLFSMISLLEHDKQDKVEAKKDLMNMLKRLKTKLDFIEKQLSVSPSSSLNSALGTSSGDLRKSFLLDSKAFLNFNEKSEMITLELRRLEESWSSIRNVSVEENSEN